MSIPQLTEIRAKWREDGVEPLEIFQPKHIVLTLKDTHDDEFSTPERIDQPAPYLIRLGGNYDCIYVKKSWVNANGNTHGEGIIMDAGSAYFHHHTICSTTSTSSK